MTTLSPEHYAFLDKLFHKIEWEIINPECHKSNYGNFHIHEIGGEFELYKGRVDSFFHISDHSTLEQAKATARKHQLETIAQGADLSVIPVWRGIESAPVGEKVLLFCPDRGITNEARIEIDYADNGRGSHHPWATCWQPLPTPPETEK